MTIILCASTLASACRSTCNWGAGRGDRRAIGGGDLGHLDLVAAYGDAEEMSKLLQRAGAVVCSSKVAEVLPKLGVPPGLEVIVEDRTLDRGGIDMLGRMLTRSARGHAEVW